MKIKMSIPRYKCPHYKHQGVFHSDDETVKKILPDLNWCANCTAYANPQCPDIRDDLLQIASVVLVEKGPKFNSLHQSGASFGTFIRPQICGILRNAKEKELLHSRRELPYVDKASDLYGDVDAEANRDDGWLPQVPDLKSEFEDELVRDISFRETLPKLLQMLTPRERDVFARLRENQQNYEIAEALNLSESRVSQLVTQVTQKLRECRAKVRFSGMNILGRTILEITTLQT